MIVLAVRTDKPEAELYIYDDDKLVAYHKWQAHLKLAETLNEEIRKILDWSSISADKLQGLVCYKGPGSFTGLRIGLTVANAMAYSYDIPIVAIAGKNWIKNGIKQLQSGKNDKIAMPEYGRPANVTAPRK